MFKILMIINVVLTLPFAVGALVMPARVFADFGVALNAGGELVARGYAATLVGFGLALLLLRKAEDRSTQRSLLLATLAFNLIECVIQFIAGREGITNNRIWITTSAHGIVSLITVYAMVSYSKKR